MKRVVVTGIGVLTPIGNNVTEYLQGLREGRSGAAGITHFDASNFKTQFACEVKNFDASEHMDRREAKRMDPFTHYAMVATAEAVNQAGLDPEQLDLDRVGVIWGSGIGGLTALEKEIEEMNYVPTNIPSPQFSLRGNACYNIWT